MAPVRPEGRWGLGMRGQNLPADSPQELGKESPRLSQRKHAHSTSSEIHVVTPGVNKTNWDCFSGTADALDAHDM